MAISSKTNDDSQFCMIRPAMLFVMTDNEFQSERNSKDQG